MFKVTIIVFLLAPLNFSGRLIVRRLRVLMAASGRSIGSVGYVLAVLGRRTGPRGEKMAGSSPGTDSQDLATILDPFQAICIELGPDRSSAT